MSHTILRGSGVHHEPGSIKATIGKVFVFAPLASNDEYSGSEQMVYHCLHWDKHGY